ncbi:MAG: hypothetical protein JXX14_10455 [Deltaproteobacteria bacterium]|nr:hypothetical protein [Deltaproteobacteria bacterium]
MNYLRTAAAKLVGLDRRVVFIAVFVAVAIPFFLPVHFTAVPEEETIQFDNALVQALQSEKPILVDVDFGPQTMAEMEPMLLALLHRIFQSGHKAIFLTFMTEATSPIRNYLAEMESIYDLEYGRDYVFLGYASAYAYTMYGLGNSFSAYFHRDDRGTPLDRLPLMKNVNSLRDVSVVINIASNAFPRFWIQYSVTPHGFDFLAGTTAVGATEYYPYLQTGQLKGLLAGGRGAAEYETLLVEKGILKGPGDATAGLGAQSLALFTILGFILIGNVAYFLNRGKAR